MDKFKLKRGFTKIYPIDQETYQRITREKAPFKQVVKGKTSYYALCAYCDMPIQIYALKKEDRKRRLHGTHAGKDVDGIGENNVDIMKSCESFQGGSDSEPAPIIPDDDPLVQETIQFIYFNYDRILWFITKKSGVYISSSFAKNLLILYLNDKAWNYRKAKISNLPWTLMSVIGSMSLKGRWIRKDSSLHAFLETFPEVTLESQNDTYSQVESDEMLDICIQFYRHRYDKKSGNELMTIRLARGFGEEQEEFFSEDMQLDNNEFYDLCNSGTGYRNQSHLKIAENVISKSKYNYLI